MFSVSSVRFSAELLGHLVPLHVMFCGAARLFSNMATLFYYVRGSSFSAFSLTRVCLLDYSHFYGCEVVFHCGFYLSYVTFYILINIISSVFNFRNRGLI